MSERRPFRSAVGLLLQASPSLAPRIEKLIWRIVYESASFRKRNAWNPLMNYGYAPLDASEAAPGTENLPYGLRLYARVAGAADLKGKDVLEVGCGRGGGTAFVHERFQPRSMIGLDLARRAIANCRATYRKPGLEFVAGDAEHLPFPDGSSDAVLSVESSHCYADMAQFLREVHRVLRPGGLLLLADARPSMLTAEDEQKALFFREDAGRLREHLAEGGFTTLEEEDITLNVMRALELDTPSRRARIEQHTPRLLRPHAHAFAAAEGSPMYRAYQEGKNTYLRFVLQRA